MADSDVFSFEPVPHAEAVEWIRGKPAVQREVFDDLLPEIRARVFTVTGIRNFDTLQRVRDMIAELPAGGDWEKIRAEIAEELAPELGEEEADRRAELLLRLHGNQAYAAAAYRAMDGQREVFPYWQYLSMEDDRVRPGHQALHGIVARSDAEFWRRHYPPWEWGCRCLAVPLMEEDVEAMRAAEAGKPIEERDVIEGAALQKLNQGTLLRGMNRTVDVRTPSERGKPGGYEWEPGTLRMPVAALRDRYDEDVWERFSAWARATRLDGGKSVWEWLGGASVSPQAARSMSWVAQAAPVPPPMSVPDRVSPVSRVATIVDSTPKRWRQRMLDTLAWVDWLHDDGTLQPMPFEIFRSSSDWGRFEYSERSERAIAIGLNPRSPHPELTLLEEIGHWLDFSALGTSGRFASERSTEFSEFRDMASRVPRIRDLLRKDPQGDGSWHEIFGRFYAQWAVMRSGDEGLLHQLAMVRAARGARRLYFTDEELAPIAEWFDNLLKGKRWIR